MTQIDEYGSYGVEIRTRLNEKIRNSPDCARIWHYYNYHDGLVSESMVKFKMAEYETEITCKAAFYS
jgi:hypothetical protein